MAAENPAPAAPKAAAVILIPLARLVEWDNGGKGQPRKHFDPAALQELADSMRAGGYQGAPITVRRAPARPGYFEILGGHRRTRAARLANLESIPAVVESFDDAAARRFVLQDNLLRADFLPWEEGVGYAELLAGGESVAAVAGKAGKSPAYVSGRVKLAEGLGEAARQAYLDKALGVEVLLMLADLADHDLSPVRCPRCHKVNAEGTEACRSCGADLRNEFVFPAGNPQAAAVKLCKGVGAAVAAEKVERVKETYGLGAAPVQTSLGLDDLQVTQDAVAVKSALERKLGEVAALSDWVSKNLGALKQYTPDQRRAARAQLQAARRVFDHIESKIDEEAPAVVAVGAPKARQLS
jgi:ParB/RepB/Spo0J family partition protein